MAAALLHDAVGGGEAEAGAFPLTLRGEEGLEHPRQRRLVHAVPSVADRDHHVRPGSHQLALPGVTAAFQVDVGRLDHQAAAARHRVPRVHRQIDDHLLDLPGIGFDALQVGPQHRHQLDILPDQPLEHAADVAHHVVEVEYPRLHHLPPAKGQ